MLLYYCLREIAVKEMITEIIMKQYKIVKEMPFLREN